jgi:cell division protein FtsB
MVRLKPTRLLAIGGIALVGFLYWKPTHTYMQTHRELQARNAEVRELREEKARLQQRITQAGTGGQLVREARRLGLVKPGEKLFIVRGITTWRKHQHH